MPFTINIGASGVVGPASGGKVTPINSLSSVAVQVVGPNPSRTSILFHNPGPNTVYVAPVVTASGATLTISAGSLGGAFQVLPGGLLTLVGEIQTAWQAFVATGTGQPLTIMESNLG